MTVIFAKNAYILLILVSYAPPNLPKKNDYVWRVLKVAVVVKKSACQCRGHKRRVWSLDRDDPLEEEMATHASILAWGIPWTEDPAGYSPWDCRVKTGKHTLLLLKNRWEPMKIPKLTPQFSLVQSLSCVRLFVTPWITARQASLSILEFTQTHVHRLGNAIQPSHPRSSPSPPAPNPSQH